MDLCHIGGSGGGRNISYMEAVRTGSVTSGDVDPALNPEVYSGLQKVLQVFITHSANVFLLEPEDSSVLLDEQVRGVLIDQSCEAGHHFT